MSGGIFTLILMFERGELRFVGNDSELLIRSSGYLLRQLFKRKVDFDLRVVVIVEFTYLGIAYLSLC